MDSSLSTKQHRQDCQRKAVNRSLKKNIKEQIGSESVNYEMGPSDFIGTQFGMGEVYSCHDNSNSTPCGTSFNSNSMALADAFPRYGSSQAPLGQQTVYSEIQQHPLIASPTSELINQYSVRCNSSSEQTNNGNNTNFILSSGIDSTETKPWYWNTDQSGSCPTQTQPELKQRQYSIDNPQFHHQTDAFNAPLWHTERTELTAVTNSDNTSSAANVTPFFLQQPQVSPFTEIGFGKPQQVIGRRRSSKSNLSSFTQRCHSGTPESQHRPRAQSNVTLPVTRAFTSPILVSRMRPENVVIESGGTTGFPSQGQNNLDGSSLSMVNGVQSHTTSEGITQYFNTDSQSNNNGVGHNNSLISSRRQSFNDSPFMDTEEYMDLTTLLSSNINAFGLSHGLSPSLTHSTVSSPPPSVSSSSTSPSPTISTALPFLPLNFLTTSASQLFPYIVDHTSSQSANLPTSIACPVANCLNMFSRVSDLEVHFQTRHNLNLKDIVLSQTSALRPKDIPPSLPLLSLSTENPDPNSILSQPHITSDANSHPISPTTTGKPISNRRESQSMKIFPCHLCPRIFARKHDLQRHIRVHTGSKPYLCVHCQKPFARTDALSRHYKIETACQDALSQIETDHKAKKQQHDQVQLMLHLEAREMQRTYDQNQKQI